MVELSKVSRGELKFSEVFKSPFIDISTYYSTNRNYLRKRNAMFGRLRLESVYVPIVNKRNTHRKE